MQAIAGLSPPRARPSRCSSVRSARCVTLMGRVTFRGPGSAMLDPGVPGPPAAVRRRPVHVRHCDEPRFGNTPTGRWSLVVVLAGPTWLAVRGLQRILGTLLGVVAAAVLAWSPQRRGAVLVIAALQVLAELFVGRNYALALLFVTPLA